VAEEEEEEEEAPEEEEENGRKGERELLVRAQRKLSTGQNVENYHFLAPIRLHQKHV